MAAPYNIFGTYTPETRSITDEIIEIGLYTAGEGYLYHFPVITLTSLKSLDGVTDYTSDFTLDIANGKLTWISGGSAPAKVKAIYTYSYQFYYGSLEYYGAITTFARPLPPKNLYVIREQNYYILKWNAPDFNEDGTICTPKSYYIYRTAYSNKRDPEFVAVITTADPNTPPDTCYVDTLDPDRIGDATYYYQVLCVNTKSVGGIPSDWVADLFIVRDLMYNDSGLYTSSKNNYFHQLLRDIPPSVVFDKEANVIPYRSMYKWNEVTEKYDVAASDYLIFDFFPDQAVGDVLSVKVDNIAAGSNEIMQFPANYTFPITAFACISGDRRIFIIDGSHTNSFESTKLDIINSTANDGTYTIEEVKLHETLVTNELLAYYDLQLDYYPVVSGSEVVTNTSCTVTYVKDVDYNIDYTSGLITWVKGTIPVEAYVSYTYEDATKTDITVTETIPNATIDGSLQPYGQPFFYIAVQSLPYEDEIKIEILNASDVVLKTKYFKPYNYLIFISAMSVALMAARLSIDTTQQNLYKDDCEYLKLYPNFGSFFNLPKPKYMTDEQYRDLIIGSDVLPGLYNSGFKGGTWGGIKDAIKSLTGYDPDITKYTDTEGWVVRGRQDINVTNFVADESTLTPSSGDRYIVDYMDFGIFAMDKTCTCLGCQCFDIHGDQTATFTNTDLFRVFGSTGNDGVYTVCAATACVQSETWELVNIYACAGRLAHFPVCAGTYAIKNVCTGCSYTDTTDYTLDLTSGTITWLGCIVPLQVYADYTFTYTIINVGENIPENIADGSIFQTPGLWNHLVASLHTGKIAEYSAGWSFTNTTFEYPVVAEVVAVLNRQGKTFYSPLKMNSPSYTEVVKDSTGVTTYVRGVDYRINYYTGTLTWLGTTSPSSLLVNYSYFRPTASAYVTALGKVYVFDGYFWKPGQDHRYKLRKADEVIPIIANEGHLWYIQQAPGTYSITSLDGSTVYSGGGVNYCIYTDPSTPDIGRLAWCTPPVDAVRVTYGFSDPTDAINNNAFAFLYKTFTWRLLATSEIRLVSREEVISSGYIDYLDGYPVLYILNSGQVIDEYGQYYVEGADFTVDYVYGKITWKNEPGTYTPPPGRKYYVDYVFSLKYMVDYILGLLKHPQYSVYHVSGLGFGLTSFGVYPFGAPWTGI